MAILKLDSVFAATSLPFLYVSCVFVKDALKGASLLVCILFCIPRKSSVMSQTKFPI